MKYFLIILLLAPHLKAFEEKTLVIGNKKIIVEVAQSHQEHEQGLMNRESLAAEKGMLFIFDEEQILTFWMKNTLIPLSIGYFNADKELIDIQDMIPASPMDTTPKLYPSKKPAKYALEMNKGWFKKNKIKIGDKFKIETGLKSKYTRRRVHTELPEQYKGQ